MVAFRKGLDQISRGMAPQSSLQNMDFKVTTLVHGNAEHVLKWCVPFSVGLIQ